MLADHSLCNCEHGSQALRSEPYSTCLHQHCALSVGLVASVSEYVHPRFSLPTATSVSTPAPSESDEALAIGSPSDGRLLVVGCGFERSEYPAVGQFLSRESGERGDQRERDADGGHAQATQDPDRSGTAQSHGMPAKGRQEAAVSVKAQSTRPTSVVLIPIEARCTGRAGRSGC